jgi:Zn-dependent protease
LAELPVGVLFLSFLVLLFSLSVHEAAHAWTADRFGDPTARQLGRISLNPVVHIDPIGTVLLPVIAMMTGAPLIGWAKPVPVSLRYLKRYPRDYVLVALAGPASNLALAVVASVIVRLGPERQVGMTGLDVSGPLMTIAAAAFRLNLLLAVFNLLPVPPLDGGNVLGGLLRGRLSQRYEAIRPYGVLILYALMLTGALAYIIGPPYLLLARLLTL